MKSRNNISLCLAGLLFLLAGCGGGQPQLPPLAADAVILAFGDSLTHGSGADRAESYPAVLQELTGRTVVNAGVPGEVSGEGRERLPRVLEKHAPQLVILCHGGNDMLRKHSQRALADNLRAMIGDIRAAGAGVVLLGVPRPGIFLSAADLYAEVAAELKVPILEGALAEILGDNGKKSDHVHPNAQGYAELARAVHGLLIETGALPPG